jgi:hypothetical protein
MFSCLAPFVSFSFYSLCWNRRKIFLFNPLFFSFFSFVSLCWNGWKVFFSSPLYIFSSFLLLLLLRQQCHICKKRDVLLCNKVTQSCRRASAKGLWEAYLFLSTDAQNQLELGDNYKLKVRGFCGIHCCCTCTTFLYVCLYLGVHGAWNIKWCEVSYRLDVELKGHNGTKFHPFMMKVMIMVFINSIPFFCWQH